MTANTTTRKGNEMNIERGDVLVIDATTATVLGAYASREIAVDAIADERRNNNDEWLGVVVIAECTDNEAETDVQVDDYIEEIEKAEAEEETEAEEIETKA
jgi:hypothetical protein